jgi:hypothetical protein
MHIDTQEQNGDYAKDAYSDHDIFALCFKVQEHAKNIQPQGVIEKPFISSDDNY